MKQSPLLCLCLISLFVVISACFTLAHVGSSMAFSRFPSGANTHESIMQGSIIKLNNTDYNSTTAFEQPDLGNATQNVTARMVVEYGDYALQQGVYAPVGLPQIFPTRIIIEYADTSFRIGIQRPETLNQTVAPRIIIEYVDYATTLTVSPYLGAPPYPYPNSTNPPDTSPPNIVVMREPSGPQVPEGQSVVVSADITDAESGVENATLQYTSDNSTDWSSAIAVPMSLNVTLQPQNSLALSFNATIPGQSAGTRVRFRIIAYDFAGNNGTKDGITDTTTYLVVRHGPVPSLTSVAFSPNTVPAGSPTICTANVSGFNPTGAVTWSANSSTGHFSNFTSTLSSGTCSTTYNDTSAGTVNITASYSGDSNNTPSIGNATLIVTPPTVVRHDVVLSSIGPPNATVSQNASLSLSVLILNNGTVAELSVVVNATANGTLIGQQTVSSLAVGNTTTLTFSWDTTGVAIGNYTVTATVTPVAGQTDLSDISKSVTVQVVAVPPEQYDLTVTSSHDSPTPPSGWFDSGTNITESVTSPVSGGSNIQYVCTGWTGSGSVPASGTALSVTFTIAANSTITWSWKTQYQVRLDESGVGSDFASTVVSVDGVNYSVTGLPVSFWWDIDSSHSFSFASPLVVGSKQYIWNSTSGLSALRGETLTVTGSGNVVGNYMVQNQVTFDQVGVGSDFTGTVVVIDSANYSRGQLPVSLSWRLGSTHTFTFQSPLIVGASTKQYVWTGTTGLSSLQGGSVIVTTYGSIICNYKTQYYLNVTSVYDSPSPSSGWFDSDSSVNESVASLVYGGSETRYVCTGWTGSGSPSASGSASFVTFNINAASSVTWSWKTQYKVTFNESNVGSEFGSPTASVDAINYTMSGLSVSFWWDNGSSHTFAFYSPLVVTANSKQYICIGVSGLSSLQSGSVKVTTSGSVTGNYKTQYYLNVVSTHGSPSPASGWFDSKSNVVESVTSPVSGVSSTQYVCIGWDGTGSVPASGTGVSLAFTITTTSTITWNWKTQYKVTFSESGIGSDFTGTAVTVDTYNCAASDLPLSLWWDNGSSHSFSFASPLVAGSSQYVWNSTSGLLTLQSGTVAARGPGGIVGNYASQTQLRTLPLWLIMPSIVGLALVGTSVLLVFLGILGEQKRRALSKKNQQKKTL